MCLSVRHACVYVCMCREREQSETKRERTRARARARERASERGREREGEREGEESISECKAHQNFTLRYKLVNSQALSVATK